MVAATSICATSIDWGARSAISRPGRSFILRHRASCLLRSPIRSKTYEINFIGTFALLQALKSSGFKGRLLFVGSTDPYGVVSPEEPPVEETYPRRPRSPYAVSKVAAEALCYQWSQLEDFEIVTTRPFNYIGPSQSTRFVVSDFARQVIE